MLEVIISASILVLLLISFYHQRKSFLYSKKALNSAKKEIEHLLTLCDILSSGIIPPAANFYHRVREAGPGCDLEEVTRKANLTHFEQTRDKILQMRDITEDPEKKEKMQKMVDELEGMYNIYSTLDENSSKEYAEQVSNNLRKSIERIMTGDFDDEFGV